MDTAARNLRLGDAVQLSRADQRHVTRLQMRVDGCPERICVAVWYDNARTPVVYDPRAVLSVRDSERAL